jgi:hypothetical protein
MKFEEIIIRSMMAFGVGGGVIASPLMYRVMPT